MSNNKEEWYSTIQAEPTPESVKGEQAKIKLKSLGYVWCESRADYVMRPMKRLIDEVDLTYETTDTKLKARFK